MFDMATYVLDFFGNISVIDSLNDESLKFNNNLPIYNMSHYL